MVLFRGLYAILTVLPLISAQSHPLPTQWTLTQPGTSGVAAMQLSIVSPSLAIIFDKVEGNPLQVNGHPAWSALYNLDTNVVTPLDLATNSFCAGGGFISNGTLVNVGGNPTVLPQNGDGNGIQGIRLFGPCTTTDGSGCTVFDNPNVVALQRARWYPSALRIADGSLMVIGGCIAGGFLNAANVNSASYEFFPSKGAPINSPFLVDTLGANLFPIVFLLPDDTIFMAANNQSMIYNIQTNTETRLPPFPNNLRVTYPMTGTGVLLPLSPPNYTPEVLICGGSTVSDEVDPSTISSQTPASAQCVRMVLNSAGIAAGWQVESMPDPRIMPDAVLLPNGQVMIVNGGKTGVAGYGNVANEIGQSNADNPAFTPVLYTPTNAAGSRFSSSGLPTSTIARLYHSVATLTGAGNIMIAGSNPNLDVTTTKYPTEYRVEFLNPPFFTTTRPTITALPSQILYGQQVTATVTVPTGLSHTLIQVALMDLGFSTHATHSDSRLVFLTATLNGSTLTITGPPTTGVYAPGPGYIYFVVNGVWSQGTKVMIGSGGNPPVSS